MARTPAPAIDQHSRLQSAADLFNAELFDGTLPPAYITMIVKPGCYGLFFPDRYQNKKGQSVDQIALCARTAVERPLPELLSTLVHEMCHQAAYENSGRKNPGGHGTAWRNLMDAVGLPPVRIGGDWRRATHRIDPDGRFAKLVAKHRSKLQELPWADVSSSVIGTKKEKDRVRFTCRKCGANAWAKPSAQLLCGSCSTSIELVVMHHAGQDPFNTGRTTDYDNDDVEPPTRIPGLPVFTDEMGRELRIHTGIDHLPIDYKEAIQVLVFGLRERGYGNLVDGVTQGLSALYIESVRKAWKVRAKQLHPDAAGSEIAFKALQTAYVMAAAAGR